MLEKKWPLFLALVLACGPTASSSESMGTDTDAEGASNTGHSDNDHESPDPADPIAPQEVWSAPADSAVLLDDAVIVLQSVEDPPVATLSAYTLDGEELATTSLPGAARLVGGAVDRAFVEQTVDGQTTMLGLGASLDSTPVLELGPGEVAVQATMTHVLTLRAPPDSDSSAYEHRIIDGGTGDVIATLDAAGSLGGHLTPTRVAVYRNDTQTIGLYDLDGTPQTDSPLPFQAGFLQGVRDAGETLLVAAVDESDHPNTVMEYGYLALDGTYTSIQNVAGRYAGLWSDDDALALVATRGLGEPLITTAELLDADGTMLWTHEFPGFTGTLVANNDAVLLLGQGTASLHARS